ncbi:MAG TPA: outer membrane beta-barrel protein, partial [Chitinophagaceae bacterium]|nr:outer membrane beta-barrel protein [Chitinophagaceae bacterium]
FNKKSKPQQEVPITGPLVFDRPGSGGWNSESIINAPMVLNRATAVPPFPVSSAFENNSNTATLNTVSPVTYTSPLALNRSSQLVFPIVQGKPGFFAEPPIGEPSQAETGTKEMDNTLVERIAISPYTIESVVNSYQKPVVARKVFLQFYLAPTVSYRKLSENKAFLRSAATSGTVPVSVAYNDVNKAVTHKPDVGLEAGVAAKYPLSRSIFFKAGIQFNVSRYGIRAFNNPGERATIALDAGAGTNSISKETKYRNFNGSRTNWLQNLYYTTSIPIGAEFHIKSRKKSNYFGFAATLQPTYIISDHAYLLSTDYKNYMEVPSLIRRWNMNSGFEAFVGYSNGSTQWQIGPQVRYQMRSSFIDQYPLKENLFDFGLKVGVSFKK